MQVVKEKHEGKPVKQTVDEIYQVSLSQLKDLYLNKQYPWDDIEKILKVFVKDDKYVLQQNSDMKAIRHLVGRGQGAEVGGQRSEVRGQTTNNQ